MSSSKRPPQPSARPSTRSSSTKIHRRSHPASSQEDPSGLPYRRAPTLTMRPHRSPITPPLTPTHRHLSGSVKEIQIAHDQGTVKPRPPVRPSTQTVTSCWRPVLEGVTATQIISSQPKTHPQYRPTRRTLQDTSAKWRRCTRYFEGSFTPLHDQQ